MNGLRGSSRGDVRSVRVDYGIFQGKLMTEADVRNKLDWAHREMWEEMRQLKKLEEEAEGRRLRIRGLVRRVLELSQIQSQISRLNSVPTTEASLSGTKG